MKGGTFHGEGGKWSSRGEEAEQGEVRDVGLNAFRQRTGGKRCSQHPALPSLVPPAPLRAEKSSPFSTSGRFRVPMFMEDPNP